MTIIFMFALSTAILCVDAFYATLITGAYYGLHKFQYYLVDNNLIDCTDAHTYLLNSLHYGIILQVFFFFVFLSVTFSVFHFPFARKEDSKIEDSIEYVMYRIKSKKKKQKEHSPVILKKTGYVNDIIESISPYVIQYIYGLNTLILLSCNLFAIFGAMVLDNSIHDPWCVYTMCGLLTLSISHFYFAPNTISREKTSKLPQIQSLACVVITYSLLVLKISGIYDINLAFVLCALLLTSLWCVIFQDLIAKSYIGKKMLNYFMGSHDLLPKPNNNLNGHTPNAKKANHTSIVLQYYAIWLAFLSITRGLFIITSKIYEFNTPFNCIVGVCLFIISCFLAKKLLKLSLTMGELNLHCYVIPLESFVLIQLYLMPFVIRFVFMLYGSEKQTPVVALSTYGVCDPSFDSFSNGQLCNQLVAGSISEHLFKGLSTVVLGGMVFQSAAWTANTTMDSYASYNTSKLLKEAESIITELEQSGSVPNDCKAWNDSKASIESVKASSISSEHTPAERRMVYNKECAKWIHYICDEATLKQELCKLPSDKSLGSLMKTVYQMNQK